MTLDSGILIALGGVGALLGIHTVLLFGMLQMLHKIATSMAVNVALRQEQMGKR